MRGQIGVAFVLACSVLGCAGDDAPSDAKVVSRLIGPAGGTLALRGGAKVEIPEDALTEPVEIKITKLELDDVADLPFNLSPAGKPYKFEPHGTVFARAVKVTLPFEPIDEDDPTSVRPIKAQDEDDADWRTVVGSDKDEATKELSFDVSSFSVMIAARPKRDSGVITLPDGAILDDASTLPDGAMSTDGSTTDSGMDSGTDARIGPDASIMGNNKYFKASNAGSDDYFGYDVAISGDTIVVGAFNEDSAATGVNGNEADNSTIRSGAAYVFVRVGGVWSQEAYLKASNTDANDTFGCSVAISGDTIVVGACAESSSAVGVNGNASDDSVARSGAAYVFTRSGTTWSQQAYLKASNTEAQDSFGYDVAIDGDTIAVSSFGENSNASGVNGNQLDTSMPGAGAVYVFTRSGVTWTQQAFVKASNPGANDHFGQAIALSGDTLVVGADGEDSDATSINGVQTNDFAIGSGAAYVFNRMGGTWSQQAYLKSSNSEAGDTFGFAVDISGDTILVGAPAEDSNAIGVGGDASNNAADSSGAAFVFTRATNVWTQSAYLKASNTRLDDQFGASLAIDGNVLVIGAPGEDSSALGIDGDDSNDDVSASGAAYVFSFVNVAWEQASYLKGYSSDVDDALTDRALDLSNGTIVAGSSAEDSSAQGVGADATLDDAVNAGAVYVFP